MQRLFTSFPAGLPGAGLLLLRSTLGIIGVIEAALLLKHDGRLAVDATAAVCGVAAILLVFGFLTPPAGVSLGLSSAALWIGGGTASWPQGALTLHLVASGAALALLGPGAYSIDARLFGRREIVVNVDRPSPRPRPSS